MSPQEALQRFARAVTDIFRDLEEEHDRDWRVTARPGGLPSLAATLNKAHGWRIYPSLAATLNKALDHTTHQWSQVRIPAEKLAGAVGLRGNEALAKL